MANVKGKNNFQVMPQYQGVDIIPPAGTVGQILARGTGDDYTLEWVTAGSGGTGTPAAPLTSIQYNNAGAFGGDAAFIFNDTLKRVDIMGTDAMPQLTIGGTTQIDSGATDSPLYVEVVTSGAIEGMRTYFNRGATDINGWISYDYDGATPNIKLVDEDDDSPYLCFEVIGTGTPASPQFHNCFGGRGATAAATTGFSWKINDVETMTHDTNFLAMGNMRMNTSTGALDFLVDSIPVVSMYTGATYSVLDIKPTATVSSILKMYEASNNGVNYTTWQCAASMTGNQDIVFPPSIAKSGDALVVTSVSGQTVNTAWGYPGRRAYYHNNNTVQTFTTTAITINFATTVRQDTGYTISAGVVTFANAGTYEISYSVGIDASTGTSRTGCTTQATLNNVVINGSRSYSYHRQVTHATQSASGPFMITVTAGQQLRITSVRNTGSATLTTMAQSCRLSITSV